MRSNKLNGFGTADVALRVGGGDAQAGFPYLGFTHWSSNLLAANHVLAGVKKAYYMYILRETWGKRYFSELASGPTLGVSINFRADFREMAWERYDDVLSTFRQLVSERVLEKLWDIGERFILKLKNMLIPRELPLWKSAVETRYQSTLRGGDIVRAFKKLRDNVLTLTLRNTFFTNVCPT